MPRIGLTLYLVAILTAGPWLCCCTAAQLAALGAATSQAAPVTPPPCCCDTRAGSDDTPANSRQPENHRPSCPCQDNRPTATVLQSVRFVSANQPSEFPDDDTVSALSQLPATLASHPSSTSQRALPPFSGRDILSLFQTLRC